MTNEEKSTENRDSVIRALYSVIFEPFVVDRMDFNELRKRMVDEQLRARDIHDERVLEAFGAVPRHLFVPEEHVNLAYEDYPLPIGEGQTISQPYMVALMTQLLLLKGNEKVLEVGTGSGYQAAILSKLCAKVFTVERSKVLCDRAAALLASGGYDNVSLKAADGADGWKEEAPFDGIVVTAASPAIPDPLREQLADGGRLVIPLGPRFTQILVRVTRQGGSFEAEEICGCVFVPLVGKHGWEE